MVVIAWARVGGGGDILGYKRGRGQSRELGSGFIIERYIWF